MPSFSKNKQTLFPRLEAIPSKYQINDPLEQKQYLLNGKLKNWEGSRQKVVSPICLEKNGELKPTYIGSYPLLTEKESLEILNSSLKAYDNGVGLWPTMSVEERIQHLEKFIEKMKLKREEVVKLLMWEIGKTLKDSEKEFDRTIQYIIDTIAYVRKKDARSDTLKDESGIYAQIKKSPLGVVLCMGPFNYPLNETFTTLIPALIMGNVVLFKPPKLGVLLHHPLLEAFAESFPPSVVNTIYGEGQEVIAPLMKSGKIDVLAFIGTSRVADILKHQHPKPHRLRSILGLEAKNAGIVLPDADIKQAVKESVLGALSYNGQRCTALKILFVHKKIVQEFVQQFNQQMKSLKMGMPWEEMVNLTPLPEPNKTEYLNALVENAKKHGAKIINEKGGEIEGTFFHPTLLFPVNEKMRIYKEEQFGPIVPIVPFDDIETPIEYLIQSNYGQQVSIFGKTTSDIQKLIGLLRNQVCRINLNCQCQRGPDTFPFAGRKDSAEGSLSVSEALNAFSLPSLVTMKKADILSEDWIEKVLPACSFNEK